MELSCKLYFQNAVNRLHRGYLLISVEDRILFHKWSKEIDIFTSGSHE